MSRALDEARQAFAAHRARRAAAPPSLFEQRTPPTLDEQLATVASNATAQWLDHALDAIRTAAARHAELTVDDVHPFLAEPVHDMRALGAAMRAAARAGVIERVPGAFRTSTRPETHARPVAVWRSTIGGRGAA